jgi:putative ABC transport system substrate-binding protein
MEWRSAEGRYDRYPELIRELVSLNLDVLVTVGNPMTRIAKDTTRTLPIVMAASSNPVEEGLIESLARPGGNITGCTVDTGPEIFAKQVQVLKELLPRMSRAAFLYSASEASVRTKQTIETAGREQGVEMIFAGYPSQDYTDVFALIIRERPDGLVVDRSSASYFNRKLIVEFASNNRLPAIYFYREMVEAGGLIAYGADANEDFRRAAGYVDRILRGAKPADLPVSQPTKFALIINLKTVKALGLEVPATLLARADEVIE